MLVVDLVSLAVLGANVALFIQTARRLRRARAAYEDATAANQQAADRLRCVVAADALLAELCVQAWTWQTTPIWRAWSETMGEVQISIASRRHAWTWSSDQQ